jgi:hypothetical protein
MLLSDADENDLVSRNSTPLIVQYLYVHAHGEDFDYPTARASSAARVASRYLECTLAQVASLRLRETECDLVLATNISDRFALGRSGVELLKQIESFGVEILPTEYAHGPADNSTTYVSSRYVLDAILTATEGQPEDRQLWFTDLDCVWVDPSKLFASAPPSPEIGCVFIPYSTDWDAVGFGNIGTTRKAIGALAAQLGSSGEPPAWVGGELLTGTPGALRELVATAEELDAWLAAQDTHLATEEQILSLAGALGRVKFHDLSDVARRILTGIRHKAPPIANPLSLGLWHLPAEKGLSLRRAARDICRGHEERLRRDFLDPRRMGRRFNVAGTGFARQLCDASWIASQRVYAAARSTFSRR